MSKRVSTTAVVVLTLLLPATFVFANGPQTPVFSEVGLHDRGSYFQASAQANVNLYGGNLVVAAQDVSIPSLGGFALRYARAYNSNRKFNHSTLSSNGVRNYAEVDSPLGVGWIGHYGILRSTFVSGRPSLEWIDASGARQDFLPHNRISAIPGRSRDTSISNRLWVLRAHGNSEYSLHTATGLTYSIERLPQYSAFMVPTSVEDADGNVWRITYSTDNGVYTRHPMIAEISDDEGRSLQFHYTDIGGHPRLERISFAGQTVASYGYEEIGPHVVLTTHNTASTVRPQRQTRYGYVQAAGPSWAVLDRITYPTGGEDSFEYDVESIAYAAGDSRTTLAVQSSMRSGIRFSYAYNNSDQGFVEASVTQVDSRGRAVRDGLVHTQRFHSYDYAARCPQDPWRTGTVVFDRTEYAGSTAQTSYEYRRLPVSNYPMQCSEGLERAVPERVSKTEDGFTTIVDYSNFDDFGFAGRQTTNTGRRTDTEYRHLSDPTTKFLLGAVDGQSEYFDGDLIGRTDNIYRGSEVRPYRVRQYSSSRDYLESQFLYYRNGGKAGAIRKKTVGTYEETYDYDNGVLKSVDFPAGPDIERRIAANGAIDWEERDGIRQSFEWDGDGRLTQISAPGMDRVEVDYDTNSVTETQGDQWVRTEVDDFGRTVAKKTRVDGRKQSIHRFGDFDALGKPGTEQTPTGAEFSWKYDVSGRPLERASSEWRADFEYSADAAGTTVATTRNRAHVRTVQKDWLGRIVAGDTNGHGLSYAYPEPGTQVARLSRGSERFERTVERDLLGRKLREEHPETGAFQYQYTPEGWLARLGRAVGSTAEQWTTYDYDGAGRIERVSADGLDARTEYSSRHGYVEATEYGLVTRAFEDPDSNGRPQEVSVRVPSTLPAPAFRSPRDECSAPPTAQLSPIFGAIFERLGRGGSFGPGRQGGQGGPSGPSGPTPTPGFGWDAVPGAVAYQLEVRTAGGAIHRQIQQGSTSVSFAAAGITGTTSFFARVRALRANGEVGPYTKMVEVRRRQTLRVHSPPWWQVGYAIPRFEWITEICRVGRQSIAAAGAYNGVERPPEFVTLTADLKYDGLGRVERIDHPTHLASWSRASMAAGIGRKRQSYTFRSGGGVNSVRYGVGSSPPLLVRSTDYFSSGLLEEFEVEPYRKDGWERQPDLDVDFDYDALGRVTHQRVRRDGQELMLHDDYRYDAWGLATQWRREDGYGEVAYDVGYTLTGQLGRFARRTASGGSQWSYRYNGAGSLTRASAIEGPKIHSRTLSRDAQNRLSAEGHRYDALGQLLQDSEFLYTYDAHQRLVEVRSRTGARWVVAQYVYDAAGHRVRSTHEDVVEYSLRGPGGQMLSQEVHHFDLEGQSQSFQRDFVYHGGQPLLTARYPFRGETIRTYHLRDPGGHAAVSLTETMTQHATAMTEQIVEYSPYGLELDREGVAGSMARNHNIRYGWFEDRDNSVHQYRGQERHRSTGLDYMMARHYSAAMGSFTQPDPAFDLGDVANPAGFGLYGYALGNPIAYWDPTGLAAQAELTAGRRAAGLDSGLHMVDSRDPALATMAAHGAHWLVVGLALGFAAADGPLQMGDQLGAAFAHRADRLLRPLMRLRRIRAPIRGRPIPGRRAARGASDLCFGAGTLVATVRGLKNIEEIQAGDLVWARDEHTGDEDWKPVTAVSTTPDRELLELNFQGTGGSRQMLLVTTEHPFWSLDEREWVAAGNLDLGERVDALRGAMRLIRVRASSAKQTVYNFEVADSHTYFVGDAKIWVHNTCPKIAREAVRRSQGPKGITRIDKPDPRYPHTQWEAHTGGRGSPALLKDGTWKHVPEGNAPPSLPKKTESWLRGHGWEI